MQNIEIIRFLHYFVTDKLMLTALDYFIDTITLFQLWGILHSNMYTHVEYASTFITI